MFHSGMLRPYSQTLDWAGKAGWEQTHLLIRPFLSYEEKRFKTFAPLIVVFRQNCILMKKHFSFISDSC
jgi:hypothetical protein